jgi:hypothetical protein
MEVKWIGNLAIWLSIVCIVAWCDRAFAAEEFIPGELIIGFASTADRDTFVQRGECVLLDVTAGGEKPAGVNFEIVGRVSLRLKIKFSSNLESRLQDDPASELQILEEVAEQLKAKFKTIRYAHPNWIAVPVPLNQVDRLTQCSP